jgi:hypothetical protein
MQLLLFMYWIFIIYHILFMICDTPIIEYMIKSPSSVQVIGMRC